MKKTIKAARQIGILLVGLPVLTVGIVLIPLPGPGLLVCLLGLLILSLEFDWAQKLVDRLRDYLKRMTNPAKDDNSGRDQ